MVVFIRSNDITPDPRLQKYLSFLDEKNIEYMVLAWDREKKNVIKKNTIFFRLPAKYGQRYKNIPKKILWFLFILKNLYINRKKYSIVHACDLDTCIPAYIIKILFNKKLIFDVFDITSNIDGKGMFNAFIMHLENYLFRKSDFVIICEIERIKQFLYKRNDILVMPNIPILNNIKDDESILNKMKRYNKNYKIVLSYVGVFDLNRGIENILDVVSKNKNIILHIGGFGYLGKYIEDIAKNNSNIIYWGKVDYNTGLNIMKNSDIILAMYYTENNYIHKYAAPNKYYEGLALNKPIITTEKTLIGDKTKSHKTGFVIGESKEALESLLLMDGIKKDACVMAENAKKLWELKYCKYIEKFMQEDYINIIN